MDRTSKLDLGSQAARAAGIRTLAARIWLTKGLAQNAATRAAQWGGHAIGQHGGNPAGGTVARARGPDDRH